jgi:hypothetical protein
MGVRVEGYKTRAHLCACYSYHEAREILLIVELTEKANSWATSSFELLISPGVRNEDVSNGPIPRGDITIDSFTLALSNWGHWSDAGLSQRAMRLQGPTLECRLNDVHDEQLNSPEWNTLHSYYCIWSDRIFATICIMMLRYISIESKEEDSPS